MFTAIAHKNIDAARGYLVEQLSHKFAVRETHFLGGTPYPDQIGSNGCLTVARGWPRVCPSVGSAEVVQT